MKVIFLDIDGVLNSIQSCKRFHTEYGGNGYGGFAIDPDDPTTVHHENILWDEYCVNLLKEVVKETDAFIVISSTWGNNFDTEMFKLMFECYGWPDAPVIGRTPKKLSNTFRGNEINWFLEDWQKRCGVMPYVILDDDTDFHNHQQPFLVHVNSEIGLTKEDAHKAIEILSY